MVEAGRGSEGRVLLLDQKVRCVRPPDRPLGSNHRAKALNDPVRPTGRAARLGSTVLLNKNKKSPLPQRERTKHQHRLTEAATSLPGCDGARYVMTSADLCKLF